MYLSAKIFLLAFCILCNICTTFATNPTDIASASVPENDDVTSEEDLSEDAILIKKCEGIISSVFKSPNRKDNLNYGFYYLHKKQFNRRDPHFPYTFGYYSDLINKAIVLESSPVIWSPREFCAYEYRQYAGECVEVLKKTKMDLDLGGKEAYEFMYFAIDYESITLENFFPDWIPENTLLKDYENYKQEIHISLDIHETKLNMIQKYFLYLYNESTNFRSIEEKIRECTDSITRTYTLFPDASPLENFLHAFYSLHEYQFKGEDPLSVDAYGYFKDQISGAILPDNIWNPKEYCRYIHKQRKKDCINNIVLILDCKADTTGNNAFNLMYRSWDWVSLNVEMIYGIVSSSFNEDNNAILLSHDRYYDFYESKLRMIQGYFMYLYEKAKKVDTTNLKSPKDYCRLKLSR